MSAKTACQAMAKTVRAFATYTPNTMRPSPVVLDTYGTRRPIRTFASHFVRAVAPARPLNVEPANATGLSVAEATRNQHSILSNDVFAYDFVEAEWKN